MLNDLSLLYSRWPTKLTILTEFIHRGSYKNCHFIDVEKPRRKPSTVLQERTVVIWLLSYLSFFSFPAPTIIAEWMAQRCVMMKPMIDELRTIHLFRLRHSRRNVHSFQTVGFFFSSSSSIPWSWWRWNADNVFSLFTTNFSKFFVIVYLFGLLIFLLF